jgi:hypothetical protein
MKISIKMNGLILLTSIISMAFITGCSKERTDTKQNQSDYTQMTNYMDSKKQQEQVFEIDGSGNGPIIGNQGTKIWGSKEILMFPNGDSVQWPFTVNLVELYTQKDMIYYQMPTVSNGILLTTGGEIRLRAFKDGQELVLRPDKTWTVEMPNNSPLQDMKIYYGVENPSYVDWTATPAGNFTDTTYGYTGEIKKLGWVACGKIAYNTTSTTNYTFQSASDDLQNINIFIYLSGIKSLMQVYNQTSGALPIGEDAKTILMGINTNNQLFYSFKDTLVSSKNLWNVKMDSISDAGLTSILDAL